MTLFWVVMGCWNFRNKKKLERNRKQKVPLQMNIAKCYCLALFVVDSCLIWQINIYVLTSKDLRFWYFRSKSFVPEQVCSNNSVNKNYHLMEITNFFAKKKGQSQLENFLLIVLWYVKKSRFKVCHDQFFLLESKSVQIAVS